MPQIRLQFVQKLKLGSTSHRHITYKLLLLTYKSLHTLSPEAVLLHEHTPITKPAVVRLESPLHPLHQQLSMWQRLYNFLPAEIRQLLTLLKSALKRNVFTQAFGSKCLYLLNSFHIKRPWVS